MQIKTEEGMRNVSSAGVGGSGLGLGIAGTALGLLNGAGIFANGRQSNGSNECQDTRQISALQAELGKEKAERYADNVGIETYKASVERAKELTNDINNNYKVLSSQIYDLDKKVAVSEQRTSDNFNFMNYKVDTVKKELQTDINCKTDALKAYVDGTFVSGKLVMPLDNICPEAMKRYNAWEAPTNTSTTGG